MKWAAGSDPLLFVMLETVICCSIYVIGTYVFFLIGWITTEHIEVIKTVHH